MIVDPHVHVWTQNPAYPWAPETTEPPPDEATPEMLLEQMAANGVDRTVLVQVIFYRWDNRYTAHALKAYPDKFMAVCRVNPEDPAAPDHLSYWTNTSCPHGNRDIIGPKHHGRRMRCPVRYRLNGKKTLMS